MNNMDKRNESKKNVERKIKNMKNKKKVMLLAGMFVAFSLVGALIWKGSRIEITIPDDEIPMGDFTELVKAGERDTMIIPDKYNSGCNEAKIISKVSREGQYGGLNFKEGSGGTVLAVDFVYGNSNVASHVIIQDTDFSDYPVEFRKGDKISSGKEIVFQNCKFDSVRTDDNPGAVKYIFKNCTLTNFGGSNASFSNCYFGGTGGDALNPVQNVEVKDCYISDLARSRDKVVHIDGTQIFGREGLDARDIVFKNCRMEIPDLKKSRSSAGCYVNACFMVQLEFSNADNLLFEDCIINGGGYSIYAWTKSTEYELKNVVFRNIQVGNAHQFGNIYHTSAAEVRYDNVSDTDKLYVASVWKESNDKIHLSVSNDTAEERVLLVITENGKQEYKIPACPKSSTVAIDTDFDEMPFDLNIEVSGSRWVVCYDGYESADRQIRFVNWSGENVYREKGVQAEESIYADTLEKEVNWTESISGSGSVETEGMCGKKLTYVLDSDGVLTISGNGEMYNYNSGNQAPWKDYRSSIKKVLIDEGVTSVGEQAFWNCKNLEEAVLPESLKVIGKNSFYLCASLKEISLQENISSIGNMAFKGTALSTIVYSGDKETFGSINIGSNNEPFTDAAIEYEEEEIIESGVCGRTVEWVLYESGKLKVTGNGAMYNYNSGKPSPWYQYAAQIESIEIQEGITIIGEQAFRNCINIESISLPKSVTEIKKNAFIGCKNLSEVEMKNQNVEVNTNAFMGTAYKK